MAQLTNVDRWAFIKDADGDFRRLGKGITGINPTNNPLTDSKHYVDSLGPDTTVYGIAKQWALTMERYVGDGANDYIASLSEETDTTSQLVIAEAHKVPTSPSAGEDGYRPARLYSVTVVVNNEGAIQGGSPMDMDVVIYANGEGETITFDIDAGEIIT